MILSHDNARLGTFQVICCFPRFHMTTAFGVKVSVTSRFVLLQSKTTCRSVCKIPKNLLVSDSVNRFRNCKIALKMTRVSELNWFVHLKNRKHLFVMTQFEMSLFCSLWRIDKWVCQSFNCSPPHSWMQWNSHFVPWSKCICQCSCACLVCAMPQFAYNLAMHRASSCGTHRVVTHSQKTRFSAYRTSCY